MDTSHRTRQPLVPERDVWAAGRVLRFPVPVRDVQCTAIVDGERCRNGILWQGPRGRVIPQFRGARTSPDVLAVRYVLQRCVAHASVDVPAEPVEWLPVPVQTGDRTSVDAVGRAELVWVASNPWTPVDVLEVLATDRERWVREAVYGNPSCPDELKAVVLLSALPLGRQT